MPRINPVSQTEVPASVQVALQRYAGVVTGRQSFISNTEATLSYSVAAFEVYAKLDLLFDELQKILGLKQAALYAYYIAVAARCRICAAYFRKILVQNSVVPESRSQLTEKERRLINFGNAATRYYGHIANHVYEQLAADYTKKEMVVLIAFAGQLIAAAVFNNTAEIEIDECLLPYSTDKL